MRTTIRMDVALYRHAEDAASREGRTTDQFIEDAVRAALRRAPDRRDDVEELPVCGGSGLLPGVDLEDRRSLIDLMDEGDPVGVLR